ncbi:MAG: glycosyltransferase family 2 protein [Candidatus Omnitrophica bacterium]|nr:glycosyltransferase family 2 protein [Candidatus Omnitrophota bacterium]
MQKYKLSIIIPIKNNGDLLKKTLLPTLETLIERNYEIILIDDGSKNTIENIPHGEQIKLFIFAKSKGPAFARNIGAKKAQSQYIVFIDSDIEINPVHLDILYAALSNDDKKAYIGVLDEKTIFKNNSSTYENIYMNYHYLSFKGDFPIFYTSFAGISKKTFMELNGFDVNYTSSSIEDMEFGQRLNEAGIKIEVLRNVRLKHYKELSLCGLFALNYRKGSGAIKIILRKKEYKKEEILMCAPRINYLLSIPIAMMLPVLSAFTILNPNSRNISLTLMLYFLCILLNIRFIYYIYKKRGAYFLILSLAYLPLVAFFQGVGILSGIFTFIKGKKYL